MNEQKIEFLDGALQYVGTIKTTKREGRWTVPIRVKDVWFNAFGTMESLEKKIAGLETGSDVNVSFKTHGRFRELIEIRPMTVGTISPPAIQATLTPVEPYTIIDPDGTLNIEKLKMTIRVLGSDCVYIIKELDRIGQAQKEDNSH